MLVRQHGAWTGVATYFSHGPASWRTPKTYSNTRQDARAREIKWKRDQEKGLSNADEARTGLYMRHAQQGVGSRGSGEEQRGRVGRGTDGWVLPCAFVILCCIQAVHGTRHCQHFLRHLWDWGQAEVLLLGLGVFAVADGGCGKGGNQIHHLLVGLNKRGPGTRIVNGMGVRSTVAP